MNQPLEAGNRRILVVDDNEAIHQDFRKILNPRSAAETALAAAEAALFGEAVDAIEAFSIDSAYQGQEALTLVKRACAANQPYAMAFVDMRMPPGWDGVETIEYLWKEDPQLQIVICTAYSDCSWDEVSKRLELGDRLLFLKKPFDNIEVYQMANALTAKWCVTEQAALKMSTLERLVEERTREFRRANSALQAEMKERQLLESQLVQAQKLESIGQLAAGIAHEINTPIQYVGDSVEFLRSAMADIEGLLGHYSRALDATAASDPTGEIRARVKEAERSADLEFLQSEIPGAFARTLAGIERVANIVRAMKEFSFPATQEHSHADIVHALENTLVVASNEYKRLAAVETQFDALPLVKCNIGELSQVFLNLIVNAAHAIEKSGKSSDTGKISIRASATDATVEIAITDNGCGIPTAIANKVFDPFFTTKEVGRGTGQGLSIAYATVVTRHGGTLNFESEEGRGTTFYLRIPIEGITQAGELPRTDSVCA
jgi:two-component system, NtrC family, sensor kinase